MAIDRSVPCNGGLLPDIILLTQGYHRASKPQDSSERVLPWQVTTDQLICATLSHTHYCYEVGMFKVPLEYV